MIHSRVEKAMNMTCSVGLNNDGKFNPKMAKDMENTFNFVDIRGIDWGGHHFDTHFIMVKFSSRHLHQSADRETSVYCSSSSDCILLESLRNQILWFWATATIKDSSPGIPLEQGTEATG